MKLTSAPLGDIHNELGFALQEDGRRIAKFVLWLLRSLYRLHRAAMLATLRHDWRKARFEYPVGHEPFNLDASELEDPQ